MGCRGVVLFYSMHAVFRLEKALKARSIQCKPVPTPRHLSSDCGTALQFPWGRLAAVEAAVAESELDIEAIHELTECTF